MTCGKRTQDKRLNYCGDALPSPARHLKAYPGGHDQRDFTLRAQRTAILEAFRSGAKQEEELTDPFFRWGKQRPLEVSIFCWMPRCSAKYLCTVIYDEAHRTFLLLETGEKTVSAATVGEATAYSYLGLRRSKLSQIPRMR